jgi:signal transduction histidine kinase
MFSRGGDHVQIEAPTYNEITRFTAMDLPRFTMRTILKLLLVLFLVTLAGVVLDRLLHRDGINQRYLLDISNLLTGLFAAGLFYRLDREHQRRQRLLEEKLRMVADLNHHIRNALQVISFYAADREDKREVAVMREAVERIEWSLREILPKFPAVAERVPNPNATSRSA